MVPFGEGLEAASVQRSPRDRSAVSVAGRSEQPEPPQPSPRKGLNDAQDGACCPYVGGTVEAVASVTEVRETRSPTAIPASAATATPACGSTRHPMK
jgi:hypothetical protein